MNPAKTWEIIVLILETKSSHALFPPSLAASTTNNGRDVGNIEYPEGREDSQKETKDSNPGILRSFPSLDLHGAAVVAMVAGNLTKWLRNGIPKLCSPLYLRISADEIPPYPNTIAPASSQASITRLISS